MNKLIRTALVLAFFACASSLLVVTASAQSVYGSIFGTVSDKTGAVIPNATITVTDEAKGTVVTVQSNGAGDYSVAHLIPDVYDLKVVAKGFNPFLTKGIQVLADTAPRIDPTLDVGSDTGTTVEVNADSQPILKTDKADVATIFDEQQVSSLPVGDQNCTQRMKTRRLRSKSRSTARHSVAPHSSLTVLTTRIPFLESSSSTQIWML
jgi:hypothetical protein